MFRHKNPYTETTILKIIHHVWISPSILCMCKVTCSLPVWWAPDYVLYQYFKKYLCTPQSQCDIGDPRLSLGSKFVLLMRVFWGKHAAALHASSPQSQAKYTPVERAEMGRYSAETAWPRLHDNTCLQLWDGKMPWGLGCSGYIIFCFLPSLKIQCFGQNWQI